MTTPYGQDNEQKIEGPITERPSEPIFNMPPFVKWVCLLLILMQVAVEYLPNDYVNDLFIKLAFIPLRFSDTDFIWHDPMASIISPIGHALLHGNWMHLFSNLGMFLAFGTALHRMVGPEKLLLIGAIGSLAGATAVAAMDPLSKIPMIGASDAISAMLGALIYFSWMLAKIGFPASAPFASKQRILTFIGVWLAMNFLFILAPSSSVGGRIAWEAHLAGFAAGVIAAFCIVKLKSKTKKINN